ncbi:tRNA pseudouridine(38/39) synthase-like [Tubulanus polymorphus]|uniref:tRNA pseudouridine(38/39) synthase-like n=1 Tax=Tubulanus polymorphus TaxID=672921 RepID=UPI003DA2D4A4
MEKPPKKLLKDLTHEEMLNYTQSLERHVKQLQNILSKTRCEEKTKKLRKQRPFDFNKYNTRHVVLKLLYLGWDYCGLAEQEDSSKTIESILFEALRTTKLIQSRDTSNYHRCGRTDKGVSAFSQVISIDLRTNLLEGVGVKQREGGTAHLRPVDSTTEEINYILILNRSLPPEIRVLAWSPVDTEFSARFNCTQRTYKYLFPKGELDVELMQEAGVKLIGSHDFRNLCKMDVRNGVKEYIRRIRDVSVATVDSAVAGGYQMCELTITGNAFLWHQIRCIVAILFLVGEKHEMPQVIDELLDIEKTPQKPQYTMASELPLVLYECEYADIDWLYDSEELDVVVKCLQSQWTTHSVRANLVKRMITSLEIKRQEQNSTVDPVMTQTHCLIPGNRTKIHKPLAKRTTSDTLEKRLENFAKRPKLGVIKSTETE